MSPLPRRAFLKSSLAVFTATTALRGLRAADSKPRKAPRGLKIFVCDWTIRKSCSPDAFPLAAQLGFDGVQVDFGRPKDHDAKPLLFDKAHQDRILEASAQHRIPIASLALGTLNTFPYKSDPVTE